MNPIDQFLRNPLDLQQPFWLPLPTNVLKATFDAAVDSSRKRVAVVVIFINHSGSIISWNNHPVSYISDPLVLDSLACKAAVYMALIRGFKTL